MHSRDTSFYSGRLPGRLRYVHALQRWIFSETNATSEADETRNDHLWAEASFINESDCQVLIDEDHMELPIVKIKKEPTTPTPPEDGKCT